ncbi:hypothetical protein LINGRAHAP2_LOCUS35440 [Linum grandiflorum]
MAFQKVVESRCRSTQPVAEMIRANLGYWRRSSTSRAMNSYI